MKPDPEVVRRFQDLTWPNLPSNPEALIELERRLWAAAASKEGNPLFYSDWVRGVEFVVPRFNRGAAFLMNWDGSQGGYENIIGDLLGWLNAKSYEEHGVLLSAMAMNLKHSKPGDRFYGLSRDVGLFAGKTDKDKDKFWMEQITAVVDLAKTNPPLDAVDYGSFVRYVREGELSVIESPIRKRCRELVAAARRAHLTPDGELECRACTWRKPVGPVVGDIIQMHHLEPLAGAPPEGRLVNLAEAKLVLMPLCPNCHSISHAKSGGGTFSLEELTRLSGRDSG